MPRQALGIFALGLVCLASVVMAERPADAIALARQADAALRGDTTIRAVRMTVVSKRAPAPRVVAFHSWDDRLRDRSFIRVLSPARAVGTSYLRMPPNVWRYAPRRGRTTHLPPERLQQPWLDSDFTLDDWLHASSHVADYDHVLLRSEEDADGREGVRAHVVEYLPRPGSRGTWGRIEAWIEAERQLPLRRDYFDREGNRVRTLRFHDFRETEGRPFPQRWVMTPAGEAGRETRVEFESLAFDPEIDDAVFSTRNLKEPVEK